MLTFKKHPFKTKQNNEKSGIVLHVTNLFHIWLSRRHLDFHICSTIKRYDMLFWLKYIKKIQAHPVVQLVKGGIF